MLASWIFTSLILVCISLLPPSNGRVGVVFPVDNFKSSERKITEQSELESVNDSCLEISLSDKFYDIRHVRGRINLRLEEAMISESYDGLYKFIANIINQISSRTLLRIEKRYVEDGSVKEKAANEERSEDNRDCRSSLNLASYSRCLEAEQETEISLNNSSPTTQAAIEENCGRTSFLLENCWPHQLKNIKELLNSRNKSILSNTEYPLPQLNNILINDTKQSLSGCPNAQIDSQVLDRITWMWLNLCMDRKFRIDYVDHLQCLSLWNLDKAQLVCNNEYRWMKNNLQDRMSSSVTLEPKIICCMFDMFLQCVYRQARHDCGREGAQFVVNFMSRIGTDDLRFICNRELRRWYRSSKAESHKLNNSSRILTSLPRERGPFIEGRYCSDPRISDILKSIQQPNATPDIAQSVTTQSTMNHNNFAYELSESSRASSLRPEIGSFLMQVLLNGFGLFHLSSSFITHTPSVFYPL